MSDETEEVIAKGEFARRCEVSPGRVSQWIKEGKISGDALVGEGRNAKVRVAVALAQLNRNLDISQRFGNGITTNLSGGGDGNAPPPGDVPKQDTVEDRLKREKLKAAEYQNRKLEEDERARAGTYMRADDARAEMAKVAGAVLSVFEGSLADVSSAIAAQFEVPARDVLHLLRQEFKKVRASAATAEQRLADGMPGLVEDTTEEETGNADKVA